jgi:DNA-directed RNA polymerase specialized sigma24 family protein
MTTQPPRRVPDDMAATPAEIAAAIEALTPGDRVRLKRFADYRIRKLGPKANSMTGDDLIQTALTDLLGDVRRWNKSKVGFMGLLTGAIRSISSNWARSYDEADTPVVEADLRRENDEGEIYSPLDKASEPRPNPEQRLRAKQTLELIDNLFKDDEKAQMVLTAWQEGYEPAGVRELWGLSQNEYNTIVRRIRRRLDTSALNADRDRGGSNGQ